MHGGAELYCEPFQRYVPVEAQLAKVSKAEFKSSPKTVMAEKLAYWLADAVADNLMSPAFNTFRPIIIQTVKFAKDFLTNTYSFLKAINSIGGLAQGGVAVAGGNINTKCSPCHIFSDTVL